MYFGVLVNARVSVRLHTACLLQHMVHRNSLAGMADVKASLQLYAKITQHYTFRKVPYRNGSFSIRRISIRRTLSLTLILTL